MYQASPSIQYMGSVQRSADVLAGEYFRWLEENVPFVGARSTPDGVELFLLSRSAAAIELELVEAGPERTIYQVKQGYLVRKPAGGKFTFEIVDDELVVTLEEFTPRLPWPIYVLTHQVAHSVVMWSFTRHVRRRES